MNKLLTSGPVAKVTMASLMLSFLVVVNPGAALAQEDGPKVRLWDTGKIYLEKNPRLAVFKDRADWKQVPYGTTGSRKHADGDLMIEGETFYLFLFANKQDGPDLLPKFGKGVGKPCELYKVYQNSTGIRNFGYGTRSGRVNILKNTAEEIMVEHTGLGHIASQSIVTTYRAVAGRPWLEVKPVALANQQGMYSKSRLCAYVRPSGDDLIMDSMRAPYRADLKLPAPPGTMGIISFSRRSSRRSGRDFMWFMTFPPGVERHPLTHLGFSADPTAHHEEPPLGDRNFPTYLGHGGIVREDGYAGRPCMGAQYAYLGKGGVVIGVLNDSSNWGREDVWREVKKGETYTTRFKAPYAGQWKVAARLLGELDTSPQVNLVKDPGAEGKARVRIKGNDLPPGWGLGRSDTSGFGVTDKEAHSGKHSVYMKMTNKTPWGVVAGYVAIGSTDGSGGERAIDAKPNTTYYFSFWVKKAKGCTRSANVVPHGWSEPVGNRASLYVLMYNRSSHVRRAGGVSADGWQKIEGWFTTAPDTRKISVAIEFYGTPEQLPIGTTFYVDDIFLGPMVEKTPTRYVQSRAKVEAGQPFTFRSPSDGKLDYLLMYLWDRTAGTPKSVRTPMDVYRKAIEGKKQ